MKKSLSTFIPCPEKLLSVVGFLLFTFNLIHPQVIYEPINNPVYEFLDRMNIAGYITLDTEVKPFSRKYIAHKLIDLDNDKYRLSQVSKDLLDWYKREYDYEIKSIMKKMSNKNTWFNPEPRLRLYNYEDSLFQFQLSPIAGYGISSFGDKRGHNRRIGARIITTYGNSFGGSIHMSDKGEFGDNVDREKTFSPYRGQDEIGSGNGIEYSDVRAQMNFNWGWGALSLKKDYTEWGNGYFGNVILSDKAPSFPHLYFEYKPVDWLRFYYIFGSIHSGVIDSLRSVIQHQGTMAEKTFDRFIKKYVVYNMLTFSAADFWDISFGNSFIYAGDIRLEMFIPFNFYKYMDRDTGKMGIEDGNGALHFETVLRYPVSYKFYASLFLDVTSIRALIKGFSHETWLGYTIGMKKVNLFLNNLDLTLEYSKITPWVYEHQYDITTYKHLEYALGHWIGQNADQIRIQFDINPFRALQLDIYYESLRKGGFNDIYYAYDSNVEEFLYGELRQDICIGMNVTYEPIHELYVEFNYRYSDISDELNGRTPQFQLGMHHSYTFNVCYGLP